MTHGEIEVAKTEIAEWVWREELIAKALDTWPMEVIEEALGADAERVLPEAHLTGPPRQDDEGQHRDRGE